jgi:hypothetical protein
LYTPRIKKILGLITAVPTDMVSTAMMHTIGIGNLPSLDKVRTPSFAESEGRPLIRRNYMTMWRQLEFGSGIYSIAGRGPWQFGSLGLQGNRGAHFFRKATGLPYDEDAIKFWDRFGTALTKMLSGDV